MVKTLFCNHVRTLIGTLSLLGLAACASETPNSVTTASDQNYSTEQNAPNTISEKILSPNAEADDAFRQARDAFRRRDSQQLAALEPLTDKHPLHAYVTYWKLFTILKADPDSPQAQADLSRFITVHNGEYVAERAKTDWARLASSNNDFSRYSSLWRQLDWNKTEPDFVCDQAFLSLNAPNASSIRNAQQTLMSANMAQNSCKRLARKLIDTSPSWSTHYFYVLLQKKQFAFAASEARRLQPAGFGLSNKSLTALLNNPTTWLSRNRSQLSKLPAATLGLAALRMAPVSQDSAAAILQPAALDPATKAMIWGRMGFEASVDMESNALDYYRQAGQFIGQYPFTVDKDQILAWKVRAALPTGNWQAVKDAISGMSPSGQQDETWAYWKIRSDLALGVPLSQKRQSLLNLCQKPTFYGLLSCDLLEAPYPAGKNALQPPASAAELSSIDRNPSVQKALAFYALDLVWDGNREWNWAQRGMSKRMLAVMAQYAGKKGLAHRMISTSQRSGQFIFPQLFPQVHKQEIEAAAHAAGLPAEWVYGLIHQESRFIPVVSSSVGAQGLMQVMPGTARWLSKRIDSEDFQQGRLTPMQENLLLGTTYMKMVADALEDNPALVAASYNAGPGKAQAWRAALPQPVAGAIFAEIIPYGETRTYVKNVTANITEYSRYGRNPVRLTRILGTIHPQPVVKNLLP